ncbi:MAG TPA: ribosome maturation factor RimP [Bacilli bacterium]|nr:ribosome maturation factor RimP [Bacilli bacterium]HPS18781.1 ribosome maturation factor RimP [Bacilli bacterium]
MDTQELKAKLSEKCRELGFELVDFSLSFSRGGGQLSLTIDRVEPIDMNTIVSLSNQLNEYLDSINPIDNPYTLDISSLGAEKPLNVDKLDAYLNHSVHVHLSQPIKGENIYEGTLVSVTGELITISYKVKTRTMLVDIAKANISHIRLAVKF